MRHPCPREFTATEIEPESYRPCFASESQGHIMKALIVIDEAVPYGPGHWYGGTFMCPILSD